MKHLETVFNALKGSLWLLFFLVCSTAAAQQPTAEAAADNTANAADSVAVNPMDSVTFSLLTCQPHDEVYSLYGHTAIRYQDSRKSRNIDAVFNYGVFDFRKPFFVGRFVFGLTDYELGAIPFRIFLKEYRQFGSMVTEQVLNLTADEKERLCHALLDNLRPENCVYRYNFFYNNCTTKARDVIEQSIDGKIEYADREDYRPTYRDMVHLTTANNPWSRFGNDLLLGIMADQPTDRSQQEFLPNNLLYDFDHAQIYANGEYRPLVSGRQVVVPAGVQLIQGGFPLSPRVCGIILLAIGLVLFLIQWKSRRAFILWEALLMVVSGTIGIVLFLMIFSQHPTVSINLQILFFNPIHWLFLWPVVRGKKTGYWLKAAALCILFFIGALFQSYAEGIWCLASCLLLQSILHLMGKVKSE